MRKFYTVLLFLFVGILLTGCRGQKAYDFETRDTIIVGLEAEYAPYNWATSVSSDFTFPINGRKDFADGYDVAMAKKIAEGLGKKLVIKAIDWEGLIPAAERGSIDLIIAGMTPTPLREQSILFSDEYYRAEPVIVLRKDSSYANATSINDFSGAKIIAQMSTIYETLVEQVNGAIPQTSLKDYADLKLSIENKGSDIMIAELPVAIGMVNKNDDLTYIRFEEGNGFVVDTKQVIVSIGMTLINTELKARIDAILDLISHEERDLIMDAAIKRQ
ncbi:MAG: transporter substrate-binding domain-containing protein [Acholeplasmataceae bacterium]|nr:transporter substrate-binding domain-containing protein [Acholeplasmataceae bacterium]